MVTKSAEQQIRHRKDILLGTIYLLSMSGNDVSLSEIQDTIMQFQKKYDLGYAFSMHFNSSYELSMDIKDLVFDGYVHEYNYRHDSFLPKRYLKLTSFGTGHSKKLISQFNRDILEHLESTSNKAIEDHSRRWHLWARRERK